MASFAKAAFILATALAVGWALSAHAQEYNEYDPSAVTPGSIPNFPFRNCNTTNGAYRLAPVWRPSGINTYCFKIQVSQDALSCTGACCSADLHKIEFNVSSSCLVAGASVVATVNGVRTRVGATLDKAPAGPVGSAVLRLTQLGLDTTTAQDAEVCLTLKTNRGGQGCTTLEQLCSSPGFPAGTCTAAMFDVACDCCPVSQAGQALPPPPPVIPPVLRPCDVCIAATIVPPANDVRPYRYDSATCAAIQQNIANAMNSLLGGANINVFSPFAPNASQCFDTQIITCGRFNGSDTDALATLTGAVQQQLPAFVEIASGGSVCNPKLEKYTVTVSTINNVADQCLDLSQSASCFLPGVPFPNCTCNTTQGVMPFTVSPTWYAQPANVRWGRNVTEYCFTVNTLQPSQVVPSTCYNANDALAKIEWYASDAFRSAVKGFTVYPAGGSNKTIADSWGATGTDTLKVNLNWNLQQANGGKVCVAIQNPFTMGNICKGALGQCYASIFNRDNSDYCCPIYRTGP
ncbi:extracellular matrix glycoprotein pherophorin-V4 [Volvox carteri f. nagariensis]|uniref:Extracellular matrix glycoprotein pherophorin-V4 n=1 Tax=Volvox carteri f. nagariensis TaxID=3068 RepID=D8UE26_VOLCA|nr:extracellular matrix glycoprotein pherophorin-V4 [Volvox carteri f. nagariensis]EFJ42018.1 extracellular matrix glycoprotein pherophorin-V4 [Volvox carteri f. nagariensis]|eukprot:XP_002956893.1 extracellular matrix glycoprotein pherophorin-V4 [Volvox carteri f. nagariensis]